MRVRASMHRGPRRHPASSCRPARTTASHASSTDGHSAGADAGEDRRAVRGAFFGRHGLDRVAVDGRLNLAPQRATARRRRRRARARPARRARRKSSNVSRRLNATPSSTARTTWPRVWLAARPTSAARTSGSQCGVRSPIRYGAQSTPSAPGGTRSASAVMSSIRRVARARPATDRAASAATGRRPASRPSRASGRESRDRTCGCVPSRSSAGRSVAAKTTPDVPIVTLTAPGRVMPMPTAPAA